MLSMILIVQGCAIGSAVNEVTSIKIVQVSSKTVVLSQTHLVRIRGQTVLKGELKNRFPVRGIMPGHIHLELLNAHQEAVKTAKYTYSRGSTNSRVLRFRIAVPADDLPLGGVLRVAHHDAQSHAVSEPTWSDGEPLETP